MFRITETTTATDIVDRLTADAVRTVGAALGGRAVSETEFMDAVEDVFTRKLDAFVSGLPAHLSAKFTAAFYAEHDHAA